MKGSLALIVIVSIAACASSPPPPVDEVASMNLDEKIGQLIVVAAQGTFMNEASPAYRRLHHYVRDHHVSGIIWYGADVYETAWVNDRLQAAAEIPLLISADLEAGVGMRFDNTTFWPWAMAVAATGDPSVAELQGRVVAEEARLLGINQIYAPVADVNNNPDNPVINVRSYGEDPHEVARFVSAFIRGVQSRDVIATVKHFPGHGDTHTDSHRSLPVLDVSRTRLEEIELIPFRAAIDAGVESVMLGHLSIPAIDPTPLGNRPGSRSNPYLRNRHDERNRSATIPSSLSPRLVTDLLRNELGFDGLVVTDALDMGGIVDHVGAGEAAVRAIEAGADLVLKTADTDESIRAIRHAVMSGRIPMERIDRSVRRILDAKRRTSTPPFDPQMIFRGVDRPEHYDLALQTAQRAITLVREESETIPVASDANVVELIVGDFPDERSQFFTLHRELSSRLTSPPTRFILDRRSEGEHIEEARLAIEDADVVIIGFIVRTRSGEGAVAVPERVREMIEKIAEDGPPIVAISFGNPYLLREVPFLSTYIAAYGIQPVMQTAAARAIFGEAEISGRLPVTIPGIASQGSGIRRAAQR